MNFLFLHRVKEMHRCYIVTILPIGLTVLESQLLTFFEKFTAVLMEVCKVQRYKDDIVQVTDILIIIICSIFIQTMSFHFVY